jgi:tRNA(Ile)-lysidine synthase
VAIDDLAGRERRPADRGRQRQDTRQQDTRQQDTRQQHANQQDTGQAAGPAGGVVLVRPLLDVPKARLIVTLREAGIAFAEDASNTDPRYTRARLRRLMPVLAEEGLTARCLVRLARRVRRSEAAHEAIVNWAVGRLGVGGETRKVVLPVSDWRAFPEEIALRLLGRAIGAIGTEGPVEFGKLEALCDALNAALAGAATRFRRTLAGAMVSLQKDYIIIDQAPARRGGPGHERRTGHGGVIGKPGSSGPASRS